MHYTALIGNPVAHSVSHILYEELLKGVPGIEYRHLKIHVEADEFYVSVDALETLKFDGISVTLPYKQEIVKTLTKIDPTAAACGAVNTVRLKNKKRIGYNTDWRGIYLPLEQYRKPNATAVVFGSGGAARAAIYAYKQLGCINIYTGYRLSHEKQAKKMAQDMGITAVAYDNIQIALQKADFVCNATPCGMKGYPDLPFDPQLLETVNYANVIFTDVVFNPVETKLITIFKQNRATTIDGLWMMIYQGIDALSIWLDRQISVSDATLQSIHTKLVKEVGHV